MPKRINKIRHDSETRAKIQASQLINRLTDHALGNLKKPMDASQVTAAIGLLKKAIPDLSAQDINANIKGNVSLLVQTSDGN